MDGMGSSGQFGTIRRGRARVVGVTAAVALLVAVAMPGAVAQEVDEPRPLTDTAPDEAPTTSDRPVHDQPVSDDTSIITG